MLCVCWESAVMVDGGLSDPFDVTTGVLRGDVLAPFLFVVLVDYLLKVIKWSGFCRRHRLAWILNLSSTGPADQNSRRSSWPMALSSVHQRQSIWLWIATLSQPFKSMEIQSTMYQILDTLVPWWHLAQVTSKGKSHLLGVHSGSWNNFGRVHTYPLQQKLSCLILLVSLYYSMAVNRGWSPRIWKTKSTPLLPHATESCWI